VSALDVSLFPLLYLMYTPDKDLDIILDI
jgi:hypothetical protein